jgi:hypothetical protein
VLRTKDFEAPASYPLMMMVDGYPVQDRRDVAAGVHIAGLNGGYAGPSASALPGLVADAARALLDPATADIRVLWSGTVGGDWRAALVRLRRPDGATFQTVVFEHPGGETFIQDLRHVPWAAADVTPWLLATGQPGTPLLLLNPSGPGRVTITPVVGSRKRTIPIGRDGTANLGDDQAVAAQELFGATATVFDAGGRRVVRAALSDGSDDPFLVAP